MNLDQMSGLEILFAMENGELPRATILDTMPMTIYKAEKGSVVFHARANDSHINPLGGVHGGFAATVLDSVTGCAVHSMLEPGIGYGTIDLNIKMIRPVPKDELLIAEGEVLNMSRSLGISEGSLKAESGKLLATETATCMLIRP